MLTAALFGVERLLDQIAQPTATVTRQARLD
jgi:hypothetical protein